MLKIASFSRNDLLDYVVNQLRHFFPDGQTSLKFVLDPCLDQSLARLETCIDSVKMWRSGEFDYLHSSQYALFLYFLSNTLWLKTGEKQTCNKLFFLNKALNGLDCFYEIAMPEVFFIGHSVGIVLAKATYGNYLVLYQNSTVGKNHGVAPEIGEGVIMYPNTAIIGASQVGDGSVISQGVSVINKTTPDNSLVFQGVGGELLFRSKKNSAKEFFNL